MSTGFRQGRGCIAKHITQIPIGNLWPFALIEITYVSEIGKISSVNAVKEKCPDQDRCQWPLDLGAVLVLGVEEAAAASAAMQDQVTKLAQVMSVFKVELEPIAPAAADRQSAVACSVTGR